MTLITDLLPYFYIAAPRGLQDTDMNAFKEYLNVNTPLPPSLDIAYSFNHRISLVATKYGS